MLEQSLYSGEHLAPIFEHSLVTHNQVCIKRHSGATKESDTERPEEKEEYEHYASVDRYHPNPTEGTE